MDLRIAFSDGRHPIWVIMRPVVLMGACAVFLHFTASNFDVGEAKSIAGVGVVSILLDLVKRSLTA